MRSQDSDVLENAGSEHPDVEIGEADGDEAGPGEDHVTFIEQAKETPCRVARNAERGAGETIELSADDVTKRVAGERVEREEADIQEHDYCAEADAEFAAEEEGFYGVVPEEAEKNNREIKKVAMNVLQDKWKRSFATIVFANGGFANGAGRRIEKKGAVVGFAVVVAGGAKAERRAENEDGGRELPPTEGKKRRIKRGEIGSPLVELAFEGAEGGVNAEATEEDGDGKWFEPPRVAAL